MKLVTSSVAAALLGIVAGSMLAAINYRDPGDQFVSLLRSLDHEPSPPGASTVHRVVVENGEEFDFGIMGRDETREHTFLIRNNTDAPLAVSIVETTCKCTVGERPNEPVPPGGLGRITLTWTAKTFDGEFRQSATLETSDPIRKVIALSVSGRVLDLVNVEPRSLAFSSVAFGESRAQTLELRSYEQPDLEILSADWMGDSLGRHFEVTWRPASAKSLQGDPQPKSGVVCTVGLKPGMPRGRFDLRLVLHTNAEKARRLEIPVSGNVVSDVMIVGKGYRELTETLDLGVISSREGMQRRLRVMAKGPHRHDFQVLSAATEPEDLLHVRIGTPSEVNNGAVRFYPIDVEVSPGSREGRYLGGENRPVGKMAEDQSSGCG